MREKSEKTRENSRENLCFPMSSGVFSEENLSYLLKPLCKLDKPLMYRSL